MSEAAIDELDIGNSVTIEDKSIGSENETLKAETEENTSEPEESQPQPEREEHEHEVQQNITQDITENMTEITIEDPKIDAAPAQVQEQAKIDTIGGDLAVQASLRASEEIEGSGAARVSSLDGLLEDKVADLPEVSHDGLPDESHTDSGEDLHKKAGQPASDSSVPVIEVASAHLTLTREQKVEAIINLRKNITLLVLNIRNTKKVCDKYKNENQYLQEYVGSMMASGEMK